MRTLSDMWEVFISYKKGVQDPEGETTLKGLKILGFKEIEDVRTAKVFRIKGKISKERIEEACKKLLANPISQDYKIRKVDEEEGMRVRKIKNGTVIDHINPSQSLNVLRIIGIDSNYKKTTVTVAMNVPSRKMGLKDIVKVEGIELSEEEVNKIALISPNATINIIRDYKVVEKRKVKLPDIVEGVIKCANRNCITNSEKVQTKFYVESRNPIKLRCYYCERIMEEEDIARQF